MQEKEEVSFITTEIEITKLIVVFNNGCTVEFTQEDFKKMIAPKEFANDLLLAIFKAIGDVAAARLRGKYGEKLS